MNRLYSYLGGGDINSLKYHNNLDVILLITSFRQSDCDTCIYLLIIILVKIFIMDCGYLIKVC